MAGAFAAIDREEATRRMDAASIAYGRLSTMEDLAAHPQNRYVEVETPTGPVRMLAPGFVMDGQAPRLGPVPALGQHTDAILAEFAPAATERRAG